MLLLDVHIQSEIWLDYVRQTGSNITTLISNGEMYHITDEWNSIGQIHVP